MWSRSRDLNAVFSKALGVLGHAELFEPVRNLLHRGPARSDVPDEEDTRSLAQWLIPRYRRTIFDTKETVVDAASKRVTIRNRQYCDLNHGSPPSALLPLLRWNGGD